MQHGVAGGGRGVYGLGDAAEVDALAGEVVQDVEEVAHAAAQPVELPHNERIAGLEVLQTLRRAGRVMVAPLLPWSVKMQSSRQPAFFSEQAHASDQAVGTQR